MQCFEDKIDELECQIVRLHQANDEVELSIETAAQDIIDLVNEAVMSHLGNIIDEIGLGYDTDGLDCIEDDISEALTEAVRAQL